MPFSVSEDAKKRREEADRMVYEETPEEQQYAKQLRQLKAPTPYESAYADQMDTLVRDYANRKPFTYDVNSDALYRQYRALAEKEDKVIFGGRLGEYKYYDMDAVIAAALKLADRELVGDGEGELPH